MSAPAHRIGAVVLAAGESRRFGGQKLLALVDGRPLLQHALDAANAASLAPVVLVLGADGDGVAARLQLGRAIVVRNAAYASGQASSLQAGLPALEGADGAVVLLGDQPRVTAVLLEALTAAQRASTAAAVVAAERGRRSMPALLHRDLWPELLALDADVSIREFLANRDDVAVVDVAETLASLEDVDTPEDRARIATRVRP